MKTVELDLEHPAGLRKRFFARLRQHEIDGARIDALLKYTSVLQLTSNRGARIDPFRPI